MDFRLQFLNVQEQSNYYNLCNFLNLYKLRNSVFGISASTVRRLIPGRYKDNMTALDLILKSFADFNLNLMSELELENFENLLLENDQDLYQWSTGQVEPKKEFVDLIQNIKNFISNSGGLSS